LETQFPSIAIEEAGDASAALEKVDTFLPHLIFMDIKLPNGNGLDLTKKIKKDHPDMSVIILTSYDFLEYRKAAEEYGATHFLSKAAVTKDEIVALVKSLSKKGNTGK
jgi:YesN/AraC family two-component response regulator